MGIDWDTRIPIGLIIGLAGQTVVLLFGVVVWGVLVDARVSYLEETADIREPYLQRFVLWEDRATQVVKRLDRVEDRLERLERLRGIYDSPRDSRPMYTEEEEE